MVLSTIPSSRVGELRDYPTPGGCPPSHKHPVLVSHTFVVGMGGPRLGRRQHALTASIPGVARLRVMTLHAPYGGSYIRHGCHTFWDDGIVHNILVKYGYVPLARRGLCCVPPR
jgi:hypothetical protein